MLVLALDTSSPAVSAALVEVSAAQVRTRAEQELVDPRGHSEHLAPVIAACLQQGDAAPRELGAIVVGSGPGPFTGLRVGLVSAAAMAEALGVPAYGVCSLDAIAAAAAGGQDEVLVLTDARRKEVYWARYDAAGERVDGPHVARPADVPLGGAVLAGAGAACYFAERERRGPDHPAAALLVPRALDRLRAGAPSDPLTPLYLRRPDAVPPSTMSRVTPR